MSLNSSDFLTPNISNSRIFITLSNLRNGLMKITGIDESQSWEIYNSLGNNVLSGVGSVLTLDSLNAGIYMLEVRGELLRIIK